MPAPVQLATDYYLQHFDDLLQQLQARYAPLFSQAEQQFIADFAALPLDAKRLWLRMLSRKGRVFALADLVYAEISDQAGAVAALVASGFAAPPQTADELADWLQKSPKARLWRLLELAAAAGLHSLADVKKSADKAALQQAVQAGQLLSASLLNQTEPLLALRRLEPLQYLLFLYFGRIEADLSAFTLRDLGLLPTGGFKTDYRARYLDAETARGAYFYALLRQQLSSQLPKKGSQLSPLQLTQWQQSRADWPEPPDERTLQHKEQLCYQLGRQAEKAGLTELAIDWYQHSAAFPASERLLRLYHKQQRSSELAALLTQMQQEPCCDDEYYLAVDFARRYVPALLAAPTETATAAAREARRLSDLTQLLRQAQPLQLDEIWSGRPEAGVCRQLQAQGFEAVHLENNLWLALFGLLLWHELFEAGQSAIFNEFERRPRNLTTRDFYQQQQAAIEQKLALLDQPAVATQFLLQQLSRHYGKANAVFVWQSELAEPLLALVQGAAPGALATPLRKMAQDFRRHSSGYPDLMCWQRDAQGNISQLQFIEVKAPGDSVRRNQLSRFFALQQAGFSVRLCKVEWFLDPARVYAVIDVETTGGTAQGSDRITEIAVVKLQQGRVIERFSSLVNPGRRIPAFISRLTGITDAMVADAPTFAQLAPALWQLLDGCLFVAHNVKFDYGFVRAEFARAGFTLSMAQLCTVVESRRYFPGLPSYSLGNLCAHFGIALKQHHRALADAEACAQLLLLVNAQRGAAGVSAAPVDLAAAPPADR